MARTYTTLLTGDPETDRENVIQMHFRIKELDRKCRNLENRNRQLTAVLVRLTATKPADEHQTTLF